MAQSRKFRFAASFSAATRGVVEERRRGVSLRLHAAMIAAVCVLPVAAVSLVITDDVLRDARQERSQRLMHDAVRHAVHVDSRLRILSNMAHEADSSSEVSSVLRTFGARMATASERSSGPRVDTFATVLGPDPGVVVFGPPATDVAYFVPLRSLAEPLVRPQPFSGVTVIIGIREPDGRVVLRGPEGYVPLIASYRETAKGPIQINLLSGGVGTGWVSEATSVPVVMAVASADSSGADDGRSELLSLILAIAAGSIFGIFAAVVAAGRLVTPILAMTARARKVVRDEPVPDGAVSSGVAEIDELGYFLMKARRKLVTDATTSRSAAAIARRERDMRQAALVGVLQPTWVKDLNGVYVYANPALMEYIDAEARGLVIGSFTDRDLFLAKDADFIRKQDSALIALKEYCREEQVITIGGKARTFVVTKAPILGDDGEALGIAGVAFDITDRRVTEEYLRGAEAELARNARLHTAGAMVSSLAHELSQPITAAFNWTESARSLLPVAPQEAMPARKVALLRTALDGVDRETRRAGEVLGRLREFLVKGEVRREPESATLLIQDAAALASVPVVRLSDTSSIRPCVVLDVEPDANWVEVSRVQIQQVLLNLIRNAAEAMVGKPGEIAVRVRREGNMVSFVVSDDGPGLAAEVAARLFEPFLTTKPTGMGVGLSICRYIVEAHGGQMTAGVAPKGGAEFRFTVPVVSDDLSSGSGNQEMVDVRAS